MIRYVHGKTLTIMFYCAGLRGAIAYALSLHLEFENEKRHVIVTTTLINVLFTIVVLGGSTMPLLKVRLLVVLQNSNKSNVCQSKSSPASPGNPSSHPTV